MTKIETFDEYLDIVDKNDQVISKKKRSEVYTENLSNFRVVNAFIVNSQDELWLPRRTAEKMIFPLCLDMSIAGHVESGESYEEALDREAREELNIDLNQFQKHFLGHVSPQAHDVSSFMRVYEIKMDTIPDYNKNDFIDYILITPYELVKRIDKGEKVKTDLPKLVKIFYL
jgi:isopentenyl-diphosphate delta-isomerase